MDLEFAVNLFLDFTSIPTKKYPHSGFSTQTGEARRLFDRPFLSFGQDGSILYGHILTQYIFFSRFCLCGLVL